MDTKFLPPLPDGVEIKRKIVPGVAYSSLNVFQQNGTKKKLSANFINVTEELLIDTDFTLLNHFEELNEIIEQKDQTHRNICNENQILESEITLLENEMAEYEIEYQSLKKQIFHSPTNSAVSLQAQKTILEAELQSELLQRNELSLKVDDLKMELKKAFLVLKNAQQQFAKEIENYQRVLAQCNEQKAILEKYQSLSSSSSSSSTSPSPTEDAKPENPLVTEVKRLQEEKQKLIEQRALLQQSLQDYKS